ncbi:DUF4376 domain-containing protein [Microvirga terricola]|uniref:DUF4376 domain-containing protein n=1 Tax=Microvirga terricola TaxID=2719797 RepID=A0ABX0VAF3_9HYPH|nr:DUF4376 domain-containing protein [Microvirga terricola]NIX75376.1 DUF4376 domain-containing protein [Microvirga terricola]
MKVARIENGVVVEIAQVPDTVTVIVSPEIPPHIGEDGEEIAGSPAVYEERPATPADFFHPDFVFEAVGEEVAEGWTREGNVFVAPLPSVVDPNEVKAGLKAYAASKRFVIETGGIVVGESIIVTDRESQALITGAYNLALVEPDEPVDFKGASGWVEISSTEMIAIGLAVARHVRSCFRKERQVTKAIDEGTVSSIPEIDAAFAL